MTETMTWPASERTKAMEQAGMTIEEMLCHAASDYKIGCNNPQFAASYGGLDELKKELFTLVEKWESR